MKAVTNPTFGLWTMLLVTMVFLLLGTSQSLRPSHFTYQGNGLHKGDQTNNNNLEDERKGELGMELYPTGSSLPDCSHACGPCFPCKRVMVCKFLYLLRLLELEAASEMEAEDMGGGGEHEGW
nr:protein EPIDERMAL PATTERNING FACTOR 2-like [Ipomoea trifida]